MVTKYSKLGQAEDLPELQTGRYHLGCSSYTDSNGNQVRMPDVSITDIRKYFATQILLVTGGRTRTYNTQMTQYDSTELLHLQQGSVWQYAASLPSPRYGLRAGTVFNKVYIFGGNFPSEDRILSYNGTTDEWQEEGGMTIRRKWHQVLVIENVSQVCRDI